MNLGKKHMINYSAVNHGYKKTGYEIIIEVLFYLYVTLIILNQVNVDIPRQIISNFTTGIILLIVLTDVVMKSKTNKNRFLLFMVSMLLIVVDSLTSGFHEIIYLFFLLWGIRNIPINKLIKTLLSALVVNVVIVHLLTIAGIIDNSQIYSLMRQI